MSLYFILAATYGLAAAAMPGPLAAFLISHSLAHGWRRTFPAAFAPLVSDGPIAVLVLLVLSNVRSGLLVGLRVGGGLFVLFLAAEAFRAFRHFDSQDITDTGSSRRSLFRATMVNFLNPHPYLGWSLVLGPLLLQGWAESPASGLSVLAGFYGSMVAVLLSMIFLFSIAGALGARVNRALLGLSSIALAAFGLYQLWHAGAALVAG